MGKLFSKSDNKKQSRVTEQDKAVLELKNQRDKLKQLQKKISLQLEKDREAARKFLKDGKKEKAKLLLRKKKFGETQIEKMDGQLENIERMVHDLEFVQIEAEVVKGLKKGNESLKALQKMFSIETVEKLMEETREAAEYQQEIDELLSGSLTQQDEEDVLSELQDIIKECLPAVGEEEGTLDLPEVPAGELKGKTKARKEKHEQEAMLAS
ncbi:charged multivesicular body protein 6-B-like [Dreissena polymorpha]|uniref:Charged multivesicular body protein 6 n=1 Tax=Dreissena polymorpha TaxID=45954 RepID=A0A9D4RBH6_DREPO|nr:charged multivesicular body protein 6-B-like [Dreissena polymorpha]KAH3862261.1 hypothetical protein DPMN_025227 [Dreissena polymorpha]